MRSSTTPVTHLLAAADSAPGPPFVVPTSLVEREPWPASARWPVAPHSRLPPGLARVLLLSALVTLASVVGPCHALFPSPAQTTEASR